MPEITTKNTNVMSLPIARNDTHLFEITYTKYATDDSDVVIAAKKNTTKLYQVVSNTERNALVQFGKRFNTSDVPYEFIVDVVHVKQVR